MRFCIRYACPGLWKCTGMLEQSSKPFSGTKAMLQTTKMHYNFWCVHKPFSLEIMSIERAWVRYNTILTFLHNWFTTFSQYFKIVFAVHVKHYSFLPLAGVKPMSKEVVHAMPMQYNCAPSMWMPWPMAIRQIRTQCYETICRVKFPCKMGFFYFKTSLL